MTGTTVACRRLDRIDRRLLFLLYFISLGFIGTLVLQLSVPPVLDEVGTMANAAFLAGYDWTECVYAMGSHNYKLGAALFYYPGFLLFKDPYAIYRSALFANAMIISLATPYAYAIVRKHLLPTAQVAEPDSVINRVIPALMAVVVSVLPSVCLHSMYAKSEPLLITIPWIIIWLILEGLDCSETGNSRRKAILSVAVSFVSVYAYLTHTRGLVIVIALFITNLCMQLITRRKPFSWIPYISSTAVFIVLERLITGYMNRHIYLYGLKHGTLESAGLGALRQLLTIAGIKSMLKLIIGWLYNVFVASYGMIIVGLLITLFFIFRAFAYKRSYGGRDAIPCKETAITAFSFLNFCGSFAMGALFFFRVVHEYFSSRTSGRGDRIVFGRYTVCTVGPLVLIAFFYMIYRTELVGRKTRIAGIAIYAAVFTLFITLVDPWLDGRSVNARYFISLNTFLSFPYNGGTTNICENTCEALRYAGELAGVIMLVVLGVFELIEVRRGTHKAAAVTESRQHRGICATLVVAALYSVIILMINYNGTRLARDGFLLRRVEDVAEVLNDIALKTDIEEKYPYILVEETTLNFKHFQAALPEYRIGSYKTLAAKQDNMFILSEKEIYLEKYYEDDYYLIDAFDYEASIKGNVYIKGNELARDLMAAGYSITKYDSATYGLYDEEEPQIDELDD